MKKAQELKPVTITLSPEYLAMLGFTTTPTQDEIEKAVFEAIDFVHDYIPPTEEDTEEEPNEFQLDFVVQGSVTVTVNACNYDEAIISATKVMEEMDMSPLRDTVYMLQLWSNPNVLFQTIGKGDPHAETE